MSDSSTINALREHQAWLGYLQPEGLVVSAAALVEAQAILNRAGAADTQQRFLDHIITLPLGPDAKPTFVIRNLRDMLATFLQWPEELIVGATPATPIPEALKVPLRDFGETLEPSLALLDPKPANPDGPWQLLVLSLPQDGVDLDKPAESAHPGWSATPTQRFERLLRETGVPIGLLSNGTNLRLLYAPHGENSGHLTFPVAFLAGVPGRPAVAALELLLSSERLVTAAARHRLPAILRLSREMQSSVSTRLADQILGALYELLRGFHVADTNSRGVLLAETFEKDAQQLYNGLLTVLMRLVFLLYAEDRGLMPGSSIYTGHYSIHGLARRLQSDAERFPDTMDHRYGAWAQLVALFRTVYEGCDHPDLKLPQRLGHLFAPDRFPFLEGRTVNGERLTANGEDSRRSPFAVHRSPSPNRSPFAVHCSLPLIPDGFIHRALRGLLLLDGERLSYRTLDVEQIGSVYSAMMGFHVSRATGATVALRPGKAHGAPVPVDLDATLALPATKRATVLAEQTDYTLPPRLAAAVRDANSVDDLLVALDRRIARNATPHPLAPGTPILIPTDERRSSGSHYTPRSLTEPIVRKALEPIFARLGVNGERRTVNGEQQGEQHGHRIIPGLDRMAGGAGAGGAGLQSNIRDARYGAIRTDEPDASRSRLDPIEHRGGMGTPLPSGVQTISANSQRQSLGIGDATALGNRPGIPTVSANAAPAGEMSLAGPPTSDPGTPPETLNRSPFAVDRSLSSFPTPDEILALKVCDPAMGSGAFLVEACRQLADVLIAAWKAHSITPVIPPDEDIVLYARRIVAQRCLYGVDRNPMATDLAKLSLWLATLAKDHPFTFLDHALRTGDTLVGLSRKQIEAFHWDTTKPPTFIQHELATRIEAALRTRRLILEAGDQMVPGIKAQKLAIADDTLQLARDLGDACISAFFSADKPKAREERRGALLTAIENYLTRHDYTDAGGKAVLDAAKFRRTGARPFPPFHWEIEFPEVFNRENSGFDAIVGNPPFLGGTRISTVAGMDYFQWLVTTYPPCGHLCDLVAYFFRRAFALLRVEGTFGLIATNTIAQGDTREGGLRVILGDGGQIYDATRRFKWPGSVAVVVSVVHVAKGLPFAPPLLDGTHVSRISAFLANGQTDDSPARLCRNPYFSLGSKIYGQGFLFDDGDPECTSTHERDRIVAAQPSAGSRIRPYIGGEEILSDPRHQYHRYVILFTDVDKESDLNQWPDLKAIVQAKVKPERDVLGNNPNNVPLKRKWWAFQAHRPELYLRLSRMKQVLVTSQVNPQFGFAILPADWIYSQKAVVLCVESYAGFAAVQSRCHESWSRFFGSTSMELMNYTPSDCFETFPFPPAFETAPELEHAGHAYYDFRAALMTDLWLGLTDTYNLFHAPDHEALERLRQLFAKRAANSDWRTAEKVPADCSPFTLYPTPESALAAIIRLRELHAAMDRAVLDAYGWTDIPTACEFILDYDDAPEAEADTEAAKPSRRKKPWRYRWPDSVRDEVLARLLALNAERAEEERLAGLATTATKVVSVVANPRKRAVKAITAKQPDFLEAMAFPSTDHDCALCAALLEIVQRCDGAPSNAHLNTLLLAAHPEWCATFLPETRRAAAIPSLTGNPKQPLQWAECRDYLLQRKAITMDRQHTGHPIGVGPQHARVTTEFACNVSQTVTMAQEALARIEKLVPTEERQLPADQQIVISTLRREERVLAGVDI